MHLELYLSLGLHCLLCVITFICSSLEIFYLENKTGSASLWQMSLFFSFIFISWRLITLQYCSDFCHTLTWISHGFTCIPDPDPPSHLPLHPIPMRLPSTPGPSTCLMHPAQGPFYWHWDSTENGTLSNVFPSPSTWKQREEKKNSHESVRRQFPMDLLGFCKIHRQN